MFIVVPVICISVNFATQSIMAATPERCQIGRAEAPGLNRSAGNGLPPVMQYTEIAPDPALRRFVDAFWTLSSLGGYSTSYTLVHVVDHIAGAFLVGMALAKIV
jgi:hypothetical protein